MAVVRSAGSAPWAVAATRRKGRNRTSFFIGVSRSLGRVGGEILPGPGPGCPTFAVLFEPHPAHIFSTTSELAQQSGRYSHRAMVTLSPASSATRAPGGSVSHDSRLV